MHASRISNFQHRLAGFLMVVAASSGIVARSGSALGAANEDVEAALHKANVYIELAKATERAVESWERYQSWVNIKTGPTGKERYISYGMYELHDVEGQMKEARAATGNAPANAKLDAAMIRYMDAYEALAPVMQTAAAYYERQGYEADQLAEGKALHPKMVPLATAFLAEREAMMPELRIFIRVVEGQELAAKEVSEGRTAAWHAGNVLHTANRVLDVFPRARPQQMTSEQMEAEMQALGPDTPGEKFEQVMSGVVPPKDQVIDVKRYSEALEKYAAAVAEFNKFSGEKPDDWDDLKPLPGKLLAMLKAFQGPLEKNKGREFEGGGQMAGQMVQVYFEMFNAGNGMMGSQLRFLP